MIKTKIKLLAMDMDGTLLNEEKEISAYTIETLKCAQALGVQLIPATGRTANGLPKALLDLNPPYAITANGARILNLQTGECICETLLDKEIALKAFDLLQKYDLVLDLFSGGIGYSTERNLELSAELLPQNIYNYVKSTRVLVPSLRDFVVENTTGVEKWTMFFRTEEQRLLAWDEMKNLGLNPVSSLPRNMELSAPTVNKGKALEQIANICGVPMCETMACGDGGNDFEMIEMAGIGVAMENGMEHVKAIADYCTVTNDEDGVAKAIEKFIIGNV